MFILYEREKDRETEFFYALVPSLNTYNSKDRVRPKPGTQKSIRVSYVYGRGPAPATTQVVHQQEAGSEEEVGTRYLDMVYEHP